MHVATVCLTHLVQCASDLLLIGFDQRTAKRRLIRIEHCTNEDLQTALSLGHAFEAGGLLAEVTFKVSRPKPRHEPHDAGAAND